MEKILAAGITLDVDISGTGTPLLYLHPEHYGHLHDPFLEKLAEHWQVYAPRHPGFDGRQPPNSFRRVDDLAYLYLDLIEELDLKSVTVLGASFGGWIGLEMAIRNDAKLRSLGLIGPLGAKFSGREDRSFADLSALPEADAAQCLFAGECLNFANFSEEQLISVARERQYLAYYAWKPFLHNPALAQWLHRVRIPTHLIWGDADRYVAPELGAEFTNRISDSHLDLISGAGHYPQIEKLDETMAVLRNGPCARD